MSEQYAEQKNTWFLRVEGALRGPYPSARVRHLLLEGELSLQDGISRDRKTWRKIQEVAEVVPLKMRAQLGDPSAQAMMHARQIADQQSGAGRPQRFPLAPLLVVMLVVSGFMLGSTWLGPPKQVDEPHCHAPAAPGVNWRNCILIDLDAGAASLAGANLNSAVLRKAKLTATNLAGADLSYADLAGADLSYARLNDAVMVGANLQVVELVEADMAGADLRFADLTGSRLDGASLRGVRFGGAIWIDGLVCTAESVGGCTPTQSGKDSVSYR
ncbi:MAG: pentapeptide repeat-containing protein [Pseudomonadota bacterium]